MKQMRASRAHSAGPVERSLCLFFEDVNWHFACMKGWDDKRHGRVGTNPASCLRGGCRFQISVRRPPVKTDCLRCFHNSPGKCWNSSVLVLKLGHERFIAHPLQLISKPQNTWGHVIWAIGSVVRHKYIKNKYLNISTRSTRLRSSQECRWKWRVVWVVMSCK